MDFIHDMIESKLYPKENKKALVDIDETICFYKTDKPRYYENAIPKQENIDKINKLYDEGWEIVYWTARGSISKVDRYELTRNQLETWGCKFHDLIVGHRDSTFCYPLKPSFDLVIDDKAKRIEEL